MDKHLHIVSLDVPYPADYGGVTDIFYKVKALNAEGVKIHLHCFDYGRGEQAELNKYCEEVIYYKRNTGLKGFSLSLPYIVKSRANKVLLQNLLKDDYPVLLEGIHCTYFLYTKKLKNKKVFVRLHNVEFEYYKQLIKSEKNLLKKIYFSIESRLLKKYEKIISDKTVLLAISAKDKNVYENNFCATSVKYLPAFIPVNTVISKTGIGDYCLYHGNLSISENEKAVIWLIKNVFTVLAFPLIIAGKNPSKKLLFLLESYQTIKLIANPSEQQINKLIEEAHINILPSFNSTGIKIKLLNALFTGRFCLVNPQTVAGTGLESLCNVVSDPGTFEDIIPDLEEKIFTQEEIQKRKILLEQEFNNKKNAQQLMQWIY